MYLNDADAFCKFLIMHFRVVNAVIGGAGMIGYAFAFVSDFNKALVAAARVFKLLDRKPLIDANPSSGLKLNDIQARKIHFHRYYVQGDPKKGPKGDVCFSTLKILPWALPLIKTQNSNLLAPSFKNHLFYTFNYKNNPCILFITSDWI